MTMIVGRKLYGPWEIIGFADDFHGWLNEYHSNGGYASYVEVKAFGVTEVNPMGLNSLERLPDQRR